MSLTTDIAALRSWIDHLPKLGVELLGLHNGQFFVLDLIMIGALKRCMSLASGIDSMVRDRNMVCARALLRMHIDTATRLRAYTYVDAPEDLAMSIMKGERLDRHKSREGVHLKDGYLVDRFTEEFPWARAVYDSTSGYVHFSEQLFFATLESMDRNGPGTFSLSVGREDSTFPEESWIEVVACFNEVMSVVVGTMESYFRQKGA